MYKIFFITLFFEIIALDNTYAQIKGEYIEFTHVGDRLSKSFPSLILSLKNANYDLNHAKQNELNKVQNSIRSFSIEQYINDDYKFIVTDDTTYNLIKCFVSNHREFFTNDKNVNEGTGSYHAVFVNGKYYAIFYKLNTKFFFDLAQYLESNNCDGIVVEAVRNSKY